MNSYTRVIQKLMQRRQHHDFRRISSQIDCFDPSSLHIYTFFVSRAFKAGAASQAADADSSRAPGLTSGLQGSVNVHRGALLLVPRWQCISSIVFYIQTVLLVYVQTIKISLT